MSRLCSTTLQIGDRAPRFALFALNEQLVQLAEVLDEVPLVLIFAPGAWSPNTRRQIEELSACYARLHVAGIGVLVIVTQDARSLRRRLATQMPPFPVLADEHREASRTFGVFRALSWDGIGVTRPATFLIDRSGIVRLIYVGERDGDLPETDGLIRLAGDLFQLTVPDVVEPEELEAEAPVAELVDEEAETAVVSVLQDESAGLAVAADDGAAEAAADEKEVSAAPEAAEEVVSPGIPAEEAGHPAVVASDDFTPPPEQERDPDIDGTADEASAPDETEPEEAAADAAATAATGPSRAGA